MIKTEIRENHGITISRRRTAEDFLNDEGPYACLLKELIDVAKLKGASDIHIEPTANGVDLRIRVDGIISCLKKIALEHRESLILEAKRIFGLSIGVSGTPQDGRVSLPSVGLDLRVNLLPTHFGEKIVMRLLDLGATFEISSLGFHVEERKLLESLVHYEDGVVIVSGATGSGKTRTLYALLQAIGPSKHNIVTLEDPIEYRLEGLNQVQISRKMSFGDALRSVLRQDPDVILVGEIRDSETAKLCFQAAETGHLVFSTLHANGAREVTTRLENLGVDRLLLESSLRLSIAQRLEQKLCPRCKIVPKPASLEAFVRENANHAAHLDLIRTRNEGGCSQCHLGNKGRVPVLEWARFDDGGKEQTFNVERTLREARMIRAVEGDIDCMGVMHAGG